ncbi:MAG: ribonuclease H-like domain-containing protein [Lachnospiraceae bacterium]|nr:ribonuclease H-like domain-containing protein [Lachnospiraceae bacterium]
MERMESTFDFNTGSIRQALAALSIPPENLCFFDIETTGLSPRISSLYLIGACYFDGDSVSVVQWFANDYTSEKEILYAFFEFTKSFSTFVHYNGSTFDIPYLEKKYVAHNLPSPFDEKGSLDIFRRIKPKKDLFRTENLKLTTVEKLMGFQRKDTFSGKDCIRLYTEFMQKKYFRDKKAEELKQCLLLHNQEDLTGTVLSSLLLLYARYQPVQPRCHMENGMFVIEDDSAITLPFSGQYERDGVFFTFDRKKITVRISLYHGTLYHFYPDYKNYFYLPKEDVAVHKSVGIYVDSEFREKATAANCYIKKDGCFLPLPKGMNCEQFPLFQETKRSRRFYLFMEKESFSPDKAFLAEYIRLIF